MNNRRLPQTDSIEELARFWDTHDLTEFEGELEEVNEPVFEHATRISVDLDSTRHKPFAKWQDPGEFPIRN